MTVRRVGRQTATWVRRLLLRTAPADSCRNCNRPAGSASAAAAIRMHPLLRAGGPFTRPFCLCWLLLEPAPAGEGACRTLLLRRVEHLRVSSEQLRACQPSLWRTRRAFAWSCFSQRAPRLSMPPAPPAPALPAWRGRGKTAHGPGSLPHLNRSLAGFIAAGSDGSGPVGGGSPGHCWRGCGEWRHGPSFWARGAVAWLQHAPDEVSATPDMPAVHNPGSEGRFAPPAPCAGLPAVSGRRWHGGAGPAGAPAHAYVCPPPPPPPPPLRCPPPPRAAGLSGSAQVPGHRAQGLHHGRGHQRR